jgi:hypothetical protein
LDTLIEQGVSNTEVVGLHGSQFILGLCAKVTDAHREAASS